MKNMTVVFLILISLPVCGQTKDPYAILSILKEKYSGVRDYSVEARIIVNAKFLNIPPKNATIYYKYANKFHVQAKGFVLLPKKVSGFDPQAFIGDQYTAIYINSEKWDSSLIDVVKTIPSDTEADVILSTFWIDTKNSEVRKFEINSKSSGTSLVELFYNKLPFDLPERLVFTFNIKEMNIPKTITGESYKVEIPDSTSREKKGKVTIIYSNYLVNNGAGDKFFNKKNE
jgi:outer membrane lipoprotein-sorting protein